MNLTKEQMLEDEMILAAIIAGGMASGRKVGPHWSRGKVDGSGNRFGVGVCDNDAGPVCAVGSGLLYAGIRVTNTAISDFAHAYGVDQDYANGVSRGFELGSYAGVDASARGSAVGDAAFDFFHGGDD